VGEGGEGGEEILAWEAVSFSDSWRWEGREGGMKGGPAGVVESKVCGQRGTHQTVAHNWKMADEMSVQGTRLDLNNPSRLAFGCATIVHFVGRDIARATL
jgi:hypothetical protein